MHLLCGYFCHVIIRQETQTKLRFPRNSCIILPYHVDTFAKVQFSTDEKGFDVNSLGGVPYFPAVKAYTQVLSKAQVSIVDCIIFCWLPLFRCSVHSERESQICAQLQRSRTQQNNGIKSCGQDTAVFLPNIFLSGIHWSLEPQYPLAMGLTVHSSNPPRTRDILFSKTTQKGSGAHTASYSLGSMVLSWK